jgi:tetratricopeptide (TPR) repeat protein
MARQQKTVAMMSSPCRSARHQGPWGVRSLWAPLVVLALTQGASVRADELDELSLDGWKHLREVERYQLQIAEKYWREQDYKTAAAEYEKFVELYESSSGTPFAQLKWSLCTVQLKQQHTAIKEGFQTVIDYWPESQQAVAARYYLGRTLNQIGRVKEGKAALRNVVSMSPGHLAAVYALRDLTVIADQEKDIPAKVENWKKLTFEVKRTPAANRPCVEASQHLAVHSFYQAAFDDGVKALATSYNASQLPAHVAQFIRQPLAELVAQAGTKAKGDQLFDKANAWFRSQIPADRSTPESKSFARQCLLAVADLTGVAQRVDQVPEAYEAVLAAASPDDDALSRLASWYKSKGNFDKARDTYRRYADRNQGLNQVAYSYREQQQWPLAIETYRQLIDQDNERRNVWKPELAATFRAHGKWSEAIAVYEELYRDDSAQSSRWRWEVANTHRDAGQLKEAIGNYRQCTNFPENYKQMAWCHRQLKQFSEAIALYNQVASDSNSAPWAMLQVAFTREEAGEKEPAIVAFQQVCKKFPKDGHASVAHAHLQQKYKISVTLGGAAEE